MLCIKEEWNSKINIRNSIKYLYCIILKQFILICRSSKLPVRKLSISKNPQKASSTSGNIYLEVEKNV